MNKRIKKIIPISAILISIFLVFVISLSQVSSNELAVNIPFEYDETMFLEENQSSEYLPELRTEYDEVTDTYYISEEGKESEYLPELHTEYDEAADTYYISEEVL